MAEMAVRNNGNRTAFSDVLGFDPFRGMFPTLTAGFGFEINRVEGGYKVEFPVPGFTPDQVEVTLEERVLSITGKGEKRTFTRTLVIPDEIDAENIGAAVEHGMLTLELRIHPKAQPRKIAVSGN